MLILGWCPSSAQTQRLLSKSSNSIFMRPPRVDIHTNTSALMSCYDRSQYQNCSIHMFKSSWRNQPRNHSRGINFWWNNIVLYGVLIGKRKSMPPMVVGRAVSIPTPKASRAIKKEWGVYICIGHTSHRPGIQLYAAGCHTQFSGIAEMETGIEDCDHPVDPMATRRQPHVCKSSWWFSWRG